MVELNNKSVIAALSVIIVLGGLMAVPIMEDANALSLDQVKEKIKDRIDKVKQKVKEKLSNGGGDPTCPVCA